MRVTVRYNEERYDGKYLDLADWFAEKEGITRHEAKYIRETDRAIQLDFDGREIWVPKSLLKVRKTQNRLEQWQKTTEKGLDNSKNNN